MTTDLIGILIFTLNFNVRCEKPCTIIAVHNLLKFADKKLTFTEFPSDDKMAVNSGQQYPPKSEHATWMINQRRCVICHKSLPSLPGLIKRLAVYSSATMKFLRPNQSPHVLI